MFPLKYIIGDIPKPPHPGSFGAVRKHDIHTGIDLYCPNDSMIYAIEDGVVINVCNFTGPKVNSPWWEDTDAVLIRGKSGVILYGELTPLVSVCNEIKEGDPIGKVKRVLKEKSSNSLKLTSMLHLELYDSDYFGDGEIWYLNEEKPPQKLKNPIGLLL